MPEQSSNEGPVDRELAAVLITLAPLGDRGVTYVDIARREFDADAMLEVPWSSGERQLILVAQALWTGIRVPQRIDLAYIAGMSAPFFAAVVNGLAAYRGEDFRTDWVAALGATP